MTSATTGEQSEAADADGSRAPGAEAGLGRREQVLARCVDEVGEFLATSWNRRPALHRGTAGFDDVLDIPLVDRIISDSLLRWPQLRLVKDGRPLDLAQFTRSTMVAWTQLPDVIDRAKVVEAFAGGATVVLQGLHRFVPSVARFCRGLESDLGQPVQCNAYLTPADNQGLGVHFDNHDVFVLQVHGVKEWRVYDRVALFPPAHHRTSPGAYDDWPADHDPLLAVRLEPGDVLYLPSGHLHAAATPTGHGPSLHLTIGVNQLTWAHVLRPAIEELLGSLELREPLPAGFGGRQETVAQHLGEKAAYLSECLLDLDFRSMIARAARGAGSGRSPAPDLITQLTRLSEQGDAARLRRGPAWYEGLAPLAWDRDRIRLHLDHAVLELPSRCREVLVWILARTDFTAGDLAPFLDERGRRVLISRLIREEVLEVAP